MGEFLSIAERLKGVYGDKFNSEDSRMEIFYDFVKDMDLEMLKEAVDNYISKNEYPPLPASIRTEYQEVYERERDHRQLIESIYEKAYGAWPRVNEDYVSARREFMAIINSQPKEKQKAFADCLLDEIRVYVRNAENAKQDSVESLHQHIKAVAESFTGLKQHPTAFSIRKKDI